MRNLLDKNYVIPPNKWTKEMFDSIVSFLYTRDENIFHLDPNGKLIITNPEAVFDKMRSLLPHPRIVEIYLDLATLRNLFSTKFKINLSVLVDTISDRYSSFFKSEMKAPASIDMTTSTIIFRQDSIFKAIQERFLAFIAVNFSDHYIYRSDVRDELINVMLCLHLYLLDHELGHFFFSPNHEQKEKIKRQFITNNPKYAGLDDGTIHRMLNFLEDMYIEDRFKSIIYPNDPKIHQVYDLGRFLLGRTGYAK
jgi:hypothetical protein